MRKKENIWKKLTEEQHIEMLNFYCKDNMRELRKFCDPIINQFMSKYGISDMNRDDLYGVAVDTLADSISKYNEEKSQFSTFLDGNLKRKFLQWLRDSRRRCRCNIMRDENGNKIVIPDLSFDIPNDDGLYLKDIVSSGESIEDRIIVTEEYSPEMKKYLSALSNVQFKILEMLSDGYEEDEIKEKLHIGTMLYKDSINGIRLFSKTKYIIHLM